MERLEALVEISKSNEENKIAYLHGARLQYADLQDADLQYANLQYANLQGARLQYINLQGADLQGADLRGANLQGAYLQGADLRGAYLQDANDLARLLLLLVHDITSRGQTKVVCRLLQSPQFCQVLLEVLEVADRGS